MQDLNKLPSRYFGAPIHYAHYVNGGKGGCSQRAQGAIIFKRWLPSLLTAVRLLTMEKRGVYLHKRGDISLLYCLTRSGPNKPAAEIGGIFQICQILFSYFGTHGLLKLIVRRLQFHRNSGFELETRCEKIAIS